MELESLKSEMEMDNESVGEEQEKLYKELAHIQTSLNWFKKQNSQLSNDINEKNAAVNRQQVQIKSQEAEIQQIGAHVSTNFLSKNLSDFFG